MELLFWWKCKFCSIREVLNKRNAVLGFLQGCPRVKKQMKIQNWCNITIYVELFKGVVSFLKLSDQLSKTDLPHLPPPSYSFFFHFWCQKEEWTIQMCEYFKQTRPRFDFSSSTAGSNSVDATSVGPDDLFFTSLLHRCGPLQSPLTTSAVG